jgi:hypothetical protein
MQKAQISVEYVTIVGFVAAISIPLILIFATYSSQVNEDIISNQANTIASKIVDSAESVYYMGESSKITFTVYMPEKINSISVGHNEVVFYVRKMNGITEVVKYCHIPINGSISSSSGIQKIVVESRGDYVWVSNE